MSNQCVAICLTAETVAVRMFFFMMQGMVLLEPGGG